MIGSSEVVLSNLAYLIGAVVLAIIGGLIVWLRHRQPRSVDANVESFHRGLRALAPDGSQSGSGRAATTTASCGLRIQPRPAATMVEENADQFDAGEEPNPDGNGRVEEGDLLGPRSMNGEAVGIPSAGVDAQPLGPDRPESPDLSYRAAIDLTGPETPVPKRAGAETG